MNAIQFIKEHGVEKAREVVDGAPDWATGINLNSLKYFGGDCFCGGDLLVSDIKNLIANIDSQIAIKFIKEWGDDYSKKYIALSESEGNILPWELSLKRLVESVYLVKEHHTLDRAIEYANSTYTAPEIKVCLLDAIADYKSIYGGEHV